MSPTQNDVSDADTADQVTARSRSARFMAQKKHPTQILNSVAEKNWQPVRGSAPPVRTQVQRQAVAVAYPATDAFWLVATIGRCSG